MAESQNWGMVVMPNYRKTCVYRSDGAGRELAADRQRLHTDACFLEDDDRACLQRLRDRTQVRE